MISVVKLTTFDYSLVDKYPQEADFVLIECDASAASMTINLPDATMKHNQVFCFKKTNSNANTVIVSGVNGQTIDGASSKTITLQYVFFWLASNYQNWLVVNDGYAIY